MRGRRGGGGGGDACALPALPCPPFCDPKTSTSTHLLTASRLFARSYHTSSHANREARNPYRVSGPAERPTESSFIPRVSASYAPLHPRPTQPLQDPLDDPLQTPLTALAARAQGKRERDESTERGTRERAREREKGRLSMARPRRAGLALALALAGESWSTSTVDRLFHLSPHSFPEETREKEKLRENSRRRRQRSLPRRSCRPPRRLPLSPPPSPPPPKHSPPGHRPPSLHLGPTSSTTTSLSTPPSPSAPRLARTRVPPTIRQALPHFLPPFFPRALFGKPARDGPGLAVADKGVQGGQSAS